MQKLKTRKFALLANLLVTQPLQLSPVPSEDDELIQAIESPREVWQLEATPDTHELDEFWSGVSDDLKSDPMWFSASEDE